MFQKPPALILAGGASSRMGYDKAFARLAGKAILDHVTDRLQGQVSQLLINSNAQDGAAIFQPYDVIPDRTTGSYGPLAGIVTGMEYFAAKKVSHFLTVSIDCPFLPHDLSETLSRAAKRKDHIIIARSNGRDHPTIGLWPTALYSTLTHWLQTTDRYAVKSFLDTAKTDYVDFENQQLFGTDVDPFLNINRPEELQAAEAIFSNERN